MPTCEPTGGRTTAGVAVREARPDDAPWVRATLEGLWGTTLVARRGELVDAAAQRTLLAELDGARCGLAAWRLEGDEAELVSLSAQPSGRGVGTALLTAVASAALGEGARRLWLVTTNDNLDALRFYQRRGLRLVALRPGAVAEARTLKPLPDVGHFGIPLHDELELAADL